MKKAIILISGSIIMTSCATTKMWQATGGSKSDGTIKLSYQHNLYEKPVVNESQALGEAIKRCTSWGFNSAEAFGGSLTQCISPSMAGGCNMFQVTKEYQCTSI